MYFITATIFFLSHYGNANYFVNNPFTAIIPCAVEWPQKIRQFYAEGGLALKKVKNQRLIQKEDRGFP